MNPPLRQISPQLAGWSRVALNFLAAHGGLVICGLFLLAGLALAGDYSRSNDDVQQRQIAVANLDYILGRAASIETRAAIDRYYGAAFELPLLLAERASSLTDKYHIHRLRLTLTHLFFIIGAFFCYRLACHLFNNRLLAAVTLLLFLLHPRIYAHAYLNSKDLPFLSMFIIALYLLERAFRRDTIGAFVLLGIGVGLLTNIRIMGVMLIPAILAMRGLDLFYAGNWRERKGVLLTGGAFALTVGLTVYALSPYAWTNPVGYLTASLDLTVGRPFVVYQLFQGARLPSTGLPPQYNAVWFSITTPPLILLLGFMGMALAAARGLARPGAIFRNTRQRFQLLLLAAFLLPPLAAALLGSHQYDNWRHLYFLYAPFCLLAAAGLGWLGTTLFRQPGGPVGIYGLTGAGLGLILLQMTQLHPWQYDYFNFLVDRATPERLRRQYQMDYWESAYREGLKELLKGHPGETLVALGDRDLERQWQILPAAARQRLPAAAGRHADYKLIRQPALSQPETAFNLAFRRQIYNNTLVAAQPLDAARMPDTVIAAYQELYRQAVAGEPILRADYEVYRSGQRLTFVRENCAPEEPDAWLGAKFFPEDPDALPPYLEARPGSYATFGNHRVRLGPLCLAVFQLPDYARGDLILMQRNLDGFGPAGAPLWEGLYSPSSSGLRALIADHRRNRAEPAGADAFEVFIDRAEGRNRLIYAKRNCSPAEYAAPITLHIYPVNLADLPAARRGRSFDNPDFFLPNYGGRPGGNCLAVVPLPKYPIAAIRTGQAGVWEVNLYPPDDSGQLRAEYAALSGSQPAARSAFDLYWRNNRLIYLRETCNAADTTAGFFLHLIPVDAAALPAERQPAGFANLDFVFDRWGGSFDGKCLAAIPLPDYPIKSLRTGQHIPGRGELWSTELTAGQ